MRLLRKPFEPTPADALVAALGVSVRDELPDWLRALPA